MRTGRVAEQPHQAGLAEVEGAVNEAAAAGEVSAAFVRLEIMESSFVIFWTARASA